MQEARAEYWRISREKHNSRRMVQEHSETIPAYGTSLIIKKQI